MASITINPISNTKFSVSSSVSDDFRVLVLNADGSRSSISMDSLLARIDTGISDKVEERVLEVVDTKIDQQLDEFKDNLQNWEATTETDVDQVFN